MEVRRCPASATGPGIVIGPRRPDVRMAATGLEVNGVEAVGAFSRASLGLVLQRLSSSSASYAAKSAI
jgi:hypothetical protein